MANINYKFPLQVLLLCVLALIPLPGPGLFKITCCRDNSRIVRKIVQAKLLPVLEKYNVKLGQECPFHPDRDIFAPQQSAKQQDRPSQWTCGVCGKSFYEERFLDLHFEHRHRERINTAEDAVCLSNFCDIMRCDVLVALDGSLMFGNRVSSTDIEVWNEASARTAVAIASSSTRPPKSSLPHGNLNRPAAGTKTTTSSSSVNNKSHKTTSAQGRNSDFSRATCDRGRNRKSSGDSDDEDDEDEDEEDDDEEEDDEVNNLSCDPKEGGKEEEVVEEALPPLDRKQQRIADMQRMKANCKKEELDGLRAKCQVLIRDCIGGLLINLSQQEFKQMEGEDAGRKRKVKDLNVSPSLSPDELNRKICWYLSCDRYWEDGPPDRRAFPWLFLIVVASILSFGICLCYYIIWVLFE